AEVVRPGAHQHHHRIEGDAIARHVDHRLAGARGLDLAIDAGDEGAFGIVVPQHAELLDRYDARRAQRVDAAVTVRLHEVGEGPAGLAELHPCDAEPHGIARLPRVALGIPIWRRRARRGVEDAHVGGAVLGRHEAGEVEAWILHHDWRREHGPAAVAVPATPEERGDEEHEERDATRAEAS